MLVVDQDNLVVWQQVRFVQVVRQVGSVCEGMLGGKQYTCCMLGGEQVGGGWLGVGQVMWGQIGAKVRWGSGWSLQVGYRVAVMM